MSLRLGCGQLWPWFADIESSNSGPLRSRCMSVVVRVFRGVSRGHRSRPFRDHEFEQEFTAAFRSAGVRFIYVASLLLAAAMGCFVVIGLAEGKGLLSAPQPIRVALIALLLAFAYFSRTHREHFLARYDLFASLILL